MSFMDDIKSDQRTQILVSGMVFFTIIFPLYFSWQQVALTYHTLLEAREITQ